jgi:hypothetical protein
VQLTNSLKPIGESSGHGPLRWAINFPLDHRGDKRRNDDRADPPGSWSTGEPTGSPSPSGRIQHRRLRSVDRTPPLAGRRSRKCRPLSPATRWADQERHDDLLRAHARLRRLGAQIQVLPERSHTQNSRDPIMKRPVTRIVRSPRPRPASSHVSNEKRSRCSSLICSASSGSVGCASAVHEFPLAPALA